MRLCKDCSAFIKNGLMLLYRFAVKVTEARFINKLVQKYIFKMKRLIKNSLLLVSFGILTFFACKKETISTVAKQNAGNSEITSRSGTPYIEREMLWFSSYNEANNFVEDLKTREKNETLLVEAFTKLGINVDVEENPNLTSHPVCLVAENDLGHISARKLEEIVINQKLNNGEDVFSIIENPFWKTIMNKDNAVHIGNRIYKFYKDGSIAIVLNDDWTLYESLKTKQFDELRIVRNLILTNDMRSDWDKYFELTPEGDIAANKIVFMPLVSPVLKPNGKKTFVNVSLIEGTPTYKWVYADNTFSMGVVPNRDLELNETVTLIATNGLGSTATILLPPAACSVENFVITILENNQVKVEYPGFNPVTDPNYTIKWVFSDGTTSTANPFIKTNAGSGSVTCTLIRKSDGTNACSFTKSFILNCTGIKKRSERFQNFANAAESGDTWRMEAALWVKNGEVGCETKHYKKNFIGSWVLATYISNISGACVDMQGNYLREQVQNGSKFCIKQNVDSKYCLPYKASSGSINLNISDKNNIFVDPGKLSSSHTLLVKNGKYYIGFGINGNPRLVLN